MLSQPGPPSSFSAIAKTKTTDFTPPSRRERSLRPIPQPVDKCKALLPSPSFGWRDSKNHSKGRQKTCYDCGAKASKLRLDAQRAANPNSQTRSNKKNIENQALIVGDKRILSCSPSGVTDLSPQEEEQSVCRVTRRLKRWKTRQEFQKGGK